jgi:hypothetical protein
VTLATINGYSIAFPSITVPAMPTREMHENTGLFGYKVCTPLLWSDSG